MKKKSGKSRRGVSDELRPEYQFDYLASRPNRFAGSLRGGTLAIVLDPDVAEFFDSAEAVNALLRSVIASVRGPSSRRAGGKRKRVG